MRVVDVRNHFIRELRAERFVTDKTGVKTIEMVPAHFLADEDTIFGPVNHDYVQRELEWYQSCSRYVKDIPGGPPKIWEQVSSKDGKINSNYGWCIFHPENCYQYNHVLEELHKNPNSRRAMMIYTRPSMWYDYNDDGMSDFMCTNAVQYMVRDGALHAVVQMRSNDVVFGYRNDYAWQKWVLDRLAEDLGYPPGMIWWQVGNLHVYERHFEMVR